MGRKYPDGVFDFKELVSGDFYFVDKTMMVSEVCDARNQTFLYTRPRRFGKSINLSMLDYYFNMKYKDDTDIFKGLKIDSCDRCKRFKNYYPVISMNFGDLSSKSVSAFNESLKSMMSSVAKDAKKYLFDRGFDEDDRKLISDASSESLNEINTIKFVKELCRIYRDVFGKKTIILVDEYDHCIQKIHSPELLESVIEELKPFMEQSFKFNDNIQAGVVTGIMPLAKTSMLSSFNNPVVCSTLETEGDEFFGFTEEEVVQFLKDTGNPFDKLDEIREWYDGYHFGKVDVYNPYSVIKYLKNGCTPGEYWSAMTEGGISKDLISKLGAESLLRLKGLYTDRDSSLESIISNKITYADVLSPAVDPFEVYSYLAMIGYLKTIRTGKMIDAKHVFKVGMVNKEVTSDFKALAERADDVADRAREAIASIYDHNGSLLKSDIQSVLSGADMDSSWKLEDNPQLRHNRYRELIRAYLVTPEYISYEEQPRGYGKTDIFIQRRGNHPPVIIEVKTTIDEKEDLRKLAEEGLKQIRMQRYADEPGIEDAIQVGIGIRTKTVEVVFGPANDPPER